MPTSVAQLIAGQGGAITVRADERLGAALDRMSAGEFSRLPVVDEENRLLGMVTYASILGTARRRQADWEALFVREALVSAPAHDPEDDLFDLLDELKAANAVVIVDPDQRVLGIVTSYDATEFLRDRAEDLLHLEDIEFTLKELLKIALLRTRGETEEDPLRADLTDLFEGREGPSGMKKPKAFADLNLGDAINLLLSKNLWPVSGQLLGGEREPLAELLDRIRQTRNDLAHFRSEISPASRAELRECAHWLRGRLQAYERDASGAESLERDVREGKVVYEVSPVPGRGRYAALGAWLSAQSAERVLLSFAQLGGIVGSRLPKSALLSRAWWADDPGGPGRAWLRAGWRVAYVDLDERQVLFVRLTGADSGI